MSEPARKYDSFEEFYPFYLSEHSNRTTRRLHFIGTSLALICLLELVITRDLSWLVLALVVWGHNSFVRPQLGRS